MECSTCPVSPGRKTFPVQEKLSVLEAEVSAIPCSTPADGSGGNGPTVNPEEDLGRTRLTPAGRHSPWPGDSLTQEPGGEQTPAASVAPGRAHSQVSGGLPNHLSGLRHGETP